MDLEASLLDSRQKILENLSGAQSLINTMGSMAHVVDKQKAAQIDWHSVEASLQHISSLIGQTMNDVQISYLNHIQS